VDNLEAKYFQPRPDCHFQRAESTHAFNVLKYELDLNVPMTERSIQGINNIFCRSREDGLNTAILHSHTLTIDSILVDGTAATYATSGESLIINLPYTYNTDDSFSIHIGYHGSWSVTSYQAGFVYYPKNYNSNTLHSIAYTLGEPWDARTWMPCYDEPYDKADYGCVIAVTVPDTFIVCANGELINVTNNPDTTITCVWEESYPIATYLMHFGASRFSVWSDWFVPASGDSVEIRHFVWPA
jgi:aminopeptidase N